MVKDLELQGKKYFSEVRLFRYLNFVNPLDGYIDNLIISEKILSMISIFEVIFRNSIHAALMDKYGTDYLINVNSVVFNKKERDIVKSAIKEVNKTLIVVKESRILTELTLGFWCNLSIKSFLWLKAIHRIHPNRKTVKYRDFVKKINLILDIRNKIAHHERLIKKRPYNIKYILSAIIEQTLLLIDDKDSYFKRYIKDFMNKNSAEVQLVISRVKK